METFEMTPAQLAQARRLIRRECAAFDPDHNECVVLDGGRGRSCPQYISYSMMCYHFRDVILPLDKKLSMELLRPVSYKRCSICGRKYVPTGRTSRYCPECAKEHRRKLDRERKRRIRAARQESRPVVRFFGSRRPHKTRIL